eukprot:TRINITY_DN4807_c0_g1_i1.p1 TRINITY_DN4807_c0_g1~~TRINITY_DN4807_c0_g1_i1.p1  ORF type:complete len:1376 (+),score=353.48 TRINITY_DN4807_c0_g1_i1:107-4129(+)
MATLVRYLRAQGAHMRGTKIGCSEGGCGACTVVLTYFDRTANRVVHRSANSCLMPLCAIDGMHVTTVEGLGSLKRGLHPIQDRLAKGNGTQCGFCTPGIIMSLYAFLLEHPHPTERQLEACLDGNLCRCTGYRPIIDVAHSFAHKCAEKKCGGGTATDIESCQETTIHPVLDLPEAQLVAAASASTLHVHGANCEWHTPTTLAELLALKKALPRAAVVVGNTGAGVESHFKGNYPAAIICPTRVSELTALTVDDTGVTIGAAVTITDLEERLREVVAKEGEPRTRVFYTLLAMLERFACVQVRNMACLGANIATASPVSDVCPLLITAGATVNIASVTGQRRVPMSEFITGYRKTVLTPEEVVVSMHVPYTRANEYIETFKQSRRVHDDICIVTAAFRVLLEETKEHPKDTKAPEQQQWESVRLASNTSGHSDAVFAGKLPHIVPVGERTFRVADCSISFSGMAPRPAIAAKTEASLKGKLWDSDMLSDVMAAVTAEFPLADNVPGGMPEYRLALCRSLFFRFFVDTYRTAHGTEAGVAADYAAQLRRGLFSSAQDFAHKAPADSNIVGVPMQHLSADKHCTGEAAFTGDMDAAGVLHCVFIQSAHAHARILSIDASRALAVPGVVRVLTWKDVPGSNKIGVPVLDEEVFASEEALCVGYPLGVLVATSHELARRAVRLVDVKYEVLPAILTIEEAIAQHSEIVKPVTLQCGDVEAALKTSPHVLEGEVCMGGQEHFYLEPNAVLAVPSEGEGEFELWASTQNPAKTQQTVSRVLGLPENKVIVNCKRVGGGFGGKETRNVFISCACAVAAYAMDRPVKMVLDRDTDMSITGTRHQFLSRYRVGFDDAGNILAYDVQLYNNAGYSADLSAVVMERALFHTDAAYKIPNMRATGHVMRTNRPSNTAYRGFGAPQSMLATEQVICRVATAVGKTPNEVRELNFYKEGQPTHYGMLTTNCYLDRVWSELMDKSEFKRRRTEIAEYNATHRYRKRGIAAVPVKFGLAFTQNAFNQAGALVHVYIDGSVLVSHGGCEIGQGLHTKMAQIAAQALGIPLNLVHIGDTATDKVPNTSPTAASTQSDINGMAVLNACMELKQRLEQFRATLGEAGDKITWQQLVGKAYWARVDLCAHGFYMAAGVNWSFETMTGNPFAYFVYGAAASEVEVDTLTGEHTILRSDIVMDVGRSINPAIDVGQVEGAFTQGFGWCTLEELVVLRTGQQQTVGPSFYKIPGVGDTPQDFRVFLLRDADNPMAVHGSKGIGEPPFFLGTSVYLALQDAVTRARAEEGITGYFQLALPASVEHIRLACRDCFTDAVPHGGVEKPSWAIDEAAPIPDELRNVTQ